MGELLVHLKFIRGWVAAIIFFILGFSALENYSHELLDDSSFCKKMYILSFRWNFKE